MTRHLNLLIMFFVLALMARPVTSFASITSLTPQTSKPTFITSPTRLHAANNSGLSESDQGVLGAVGSAMAVTVLYSEFTLFSTGCGLPAGPFGLLGLAEGLSYVGIVGIGGYSLFVKVRSGSGLPAGPAGLLGAAEGLSFLAIVAGIVVLVAQLTHYGYIPNAIPMEGGMCN